MALSRTPAPRLAHAGVLLGLPHSMRAPGRGCGGGRWLCSAHPGAALHRAARAPRLCCPGPGRSRQPVNTPACGRRHRVPYRGQARFLDRQAPLSHGRAVGASALLLSQAGNHRPMFGTTSACHATHLRHTAMSSRFPNFWTLLSVFLGQILCTLRGQVPTCCVQDLICLRSPPHHCHKLACPKCAPAASQPQIARLMPWH